MTCRSSEGGSSGSELCGHLHPESQATSTGNGHLPWRVCDFGQKREVRVHSPLPGGDQEPGKDPSVWPFSCPRAAQGQRGLKKVLSPSPGLLTDKIPPHSWLPLQCSGAWQLCMSSFNRGAMVLREYPKVSGQSPCQADTGQKP